MKTSHRFSIGGLECVAVLDGSPSYAVGSLFAGLPACVLNPVLREHGILSDTVHVPYTCLAIKTGRRWVLVDTGLGIGEEPYAGHLPANLQASGILPSEIVTVIISHGHGDHVGGIVDSRGQPTYPNARYVMHWEEWDFWTSEKNLRRIGWEDGIPYMRARLNDLADRFHLIEGEAQVAPSVRVLPAVGHTPGHLLVSISSGGEHLLAISDLVAHPIHVEQPDWSMVYDIAPEQAVATRHQVLERVAADQTLVHGFHLPFPGLGHVARSDRGLYWRPID